MTQNKVMKLWTAFVTAFIALCTALGLVTTTAATATAAPQAETPSGTTEQQRSSAPTAAEEQPAPGFPLPRSLPPTMKQRITAEAHGKSPSCRQRSRTGDSDQTDLSATEAEQRATADHEAVPLAC
ncbi:hypothetical protein KUM39_26100 [Streptomyces sp. J2-1]|uniref:DUF6344 domain-containing protein n=1 Tax=Streptomyces corallincola TaxID=2851888 RepID=UPI001C389062|nr:DUF6344 domain-containing protein [Streptomyces corallincola]MBV2357789.1 hypothetical protein [Streptomyces corallincola]